MNVSPNFRPRRAHRLASHIGKVRERLAKKLMRAFADQLGLDVNIDPGDLRPTLGRERTDRSMDIYRWSGWGALRVGEGRLRCSMDSYDTMTECLKNGVVVVRDRGVSFDIHAKDA